MTELALDELVDLLEQPEVSTASKPKGRYPRPIQDGPLRTIEEPYPRCASRGCGVSAPQKVQGIPRCTVHALIELNEMLIAAGFHGVMHANT